GAQARLVHLVDGGRLQLARTARRGQRLLWRETRVLGAAQQVAQAEQYVGLGALRRQLLDDALAVVGVQHREAAAQAGARVLDLQELQAQRVEGAHGERGGVLARHQLAHALAHLARGLVGEGDRGDLRRRQLPPLDQVGDLLRDHAGLARAGARQHQQRGVAVFDGGQLLRVEHGAKAMWAAADGSRGIGGGPAGYHARSGTRRIPMAKLYFYYSAMNAGKTTTLLQSAYNYHERGMRTLILTPAIDTRTRGEPSPGAARHPLSQAGEGEGAQPAAAA